MSTTSPDTYLNTFVTGTHNQVSGPDGRVDLYTAEILSAREYSAYGASLPGYAWDSGDGYRYGFNGQEKETEITASPSHTSASFWMYDSRLGRRWNVDPKPNDAVSVYAGFANNPILFCDPYGDTIRVNYQYTDGNGNVNNKELMRIDSEDWNGSFTIDENSIPESYRSATTAALIGIETTVVDGSVLDCEDNCDASMLSITASAGLVAGLSTGFDIVHPLSGENTDKLYFYWKYGGGWMAGVGVDSKFGKVDVRNDLVGNIDETMFAGMSYSHSLADGISYEHCWSYGSMTIPTECEAFGVNCPDDKHVVYNVDLFGIGAKAAYCPKLWSYAIHMGTLNLNFKK